MQIFALLIGYIIGRFHSSQGVYIDKPVSLFAKQTNTETKHSPISIDDTKYVVDIETDSMEKKYTYLGETTKSSENISSSINKLKNIKG